jgi:hypothetical protein
MKSVMRIFDRFEGPETKGRPLLRVRGSLVTKTGERVKGCKRLEVGVKLALSALTH